MDPYHWGRYRRLYLKEDEENIGDKKCILENVGEKKKLLESGGA